MKASKADPTQIAPSQIVRRRWGLLPLMSAMEINSLRSTKRLRLSSGSGDTEFIISGKSGGAKWPCSKAGGGSAPYSCSHNWASLVRLEPWPPRIALSYCQTSRPAKLPALLFFKATRRATLAGVICCCCCCCCCWRFFGWASSYDL